jgi:hypothetical protein
MQKTTRTRKKDNCQPREKRAHTDLMFQRAVRHAAARAHAGVNAQLRVDKHGVVGQAMLAVLEESREHTGQRVDIGRWPQQQREWRSDRKGKQH